MRGRRDASQEDLILSQQDSHLFCAICGELLGADSDHFCIAGSPYSTGDLREFVAWDVLSDEALSEFEADLEKEGEETP